MPDETDKVNSESGSDLKQDILRQIRDKLAQDDQAPKGDSDGQSPGSGVRSSPSSGHGSALENLSSKDRLKLSRAKTIALRKMIFLIATAHGSLILGIAVVIPFLLTPLLHLNPLLAFAGSLVGGIIFSVVISPIQELWNSALSQACQEVGLWSVSDRLSREGASDPIAEILAGRYPNSAGPGLALKASQLQLLNIRRGEMKTAAKFGEFLYKNSLGDKDGHSYQASTLGSLYVDMGNFDRGFSLLGECLDDLEQSNRQASPAYITGLLGMMHGAVELERVEDAEKYLRRLEKAIDNSHSSNSGNRTDNWVRKDISGSESIERTFEHFYRARLKELKDDPTAEKDFTEALDIAKRPGIQRTVVLLYPDILACFANQRLRVAAFDEAAKAASEAVCYYETKTENRGLDYWKARLSLAYARFKTGNSVTDEFEEGLEVLKRCVFEPHPSVACAHLWLGEAQAKEGHMDKARENMNLALRMRRQLFSENSRGVKEALSSLEALPTA